MKSATKVTGGLVFLAIILGAANWENIVKCAALIMGGTLLAQDATAQIDQVNGVIVTPISTTYGGFANMSVGKASLPPPQVSGSLVQADGSGNINYTNGANVDQNGNLNIYGNINAGSETPGAIVLPVATTGVTPTFGDLVKTANGVVCVRVNGRYLNLANSVVQTTLTGVGSLTGTGTSSPTTCVF